MSCGAKLQPEWKFCANCRQPVADGLSPQEAGAAEAPQGSRASQSPVPQNPVSQSPVPQDGATPIVESASRDGASPFASAGAPRYDGGAPAGPGGPGGFGPGGPTGPGGFGPGSEGPTGDGTATPGKKKNRKAIILASIAVVLVVVGVGAFLFIQNMLRGGAGSPEQAAEKLIESIENNDAIGLATMVAPAEREAVDRLQEGVMEKVEEFGILEAVNKVGEGDEETDSEISFDGIAVTFENAEPEVTEIDDQLAVLEFTSGTVRVQIDPEQTRGAIRSGFEAGDEMDKIDETTDLAELGVDGGPLLIAAVKDGGRWYLSPLYTGLEMGTQSSGIERGTLPEATDGSSSPAEAAEALIGALPGILDNGKFTDLGNYLSSYEGNAVHYYGGPLDDAMGDGAGFDMELKANSFTDAEQNGDLGRATVETLEVDIDGDVARVTGDCIEFDGADEVCGNGSGYVMLESMLGSDNVLGALPPLSLSSIKEDGKWKVSLMETTTDWALEWLDSITREQALAMLDLARSEDTTGTVTPEEEIDVAFNSAGYAVLELTLEEEMELEISDGSSSSSSDDNYGSSQNPDSYSGFTVYSEDGRDEITTHDSFEEIPAGTYKLVVFAGEDWADEFADNGNDTQHSQTMTFREFELEPVESNLPPAETGYLSVDGYPGPVEEWDMQVPEGHDVTLVLTAEGSFGEWETPGTLVVTLDGEEYSMPVGNSEEELSIPYPDDYEPHVLRLELQKGDGSGFEVDYVLEFEFD